MRFVSLYGRYACVIHHEQREHYATGASKTIQAQVIAQFQPFTLTAEERQLAVERWIFNGSYQYEGEVQTVPPDYRIGGFDSREAQASLGWSDELRQEVEQVLLKKCGESEDLFVVPEKQYAPPWPAYDKYTGTPSALLRKLVDEEHDLENTLNYERQHQNRDKVIEELERALAGDTQEEVVVLG